MVSRLSVGGSVTQAILTAAAVRELGFRSVLIHGQPPAHEGSLAPLADRLGVERIVLGPLQRNPGAADLLAGVETQRLLRRLRPAVLHTHAAKAGAIGRSAARVTRVPVVVHTFHGHVLRGYFEPRVEQVFRRLEQQLARHTDCIVAVSDEVREDLIELRIAPAGKIRTIRVGLDLGALAVPPAIAAADRAAVRAELGIGEGDRVVAFAGRLEPIKRADRFLAAAAQVATPDARFLVIGDGSQRPALEASGDAAALAGRVVFAGFRDDIGRVLHAADVVVLTSDAEGTPVSLIEAGACGLPVVSTDVGGVGSVVADGGTGLIVPRDPAAIAAAVDRILGDPALATAMGRAGRTRVLGRFGIDRLARSHADLYDSLLRPTLR
jgi:glycosyltransferase involved in cell wall biosynthesis